MGSAFTSIWGSADGPVGRLAPQVRIVAGVVLFAACMVAPTDSACGSGFLLATVVGWTAVCGVPGRVLRAAVLLGLIMFVPFVALAPLMPTEAGLAVIWGIVARGTSGMLVSIGTVTTLPAADLDEGLARLPLPSMVTALVSQIVRQVGTLVDETRRISSAIALRAGAAGPRNTLRVLAALPTVWLPRIAARADRVSAAMELRGLGSKVPRFRHWPIGTRDVVAGAAVVAWLGLAVVLRLWGLP